MRHYHDIRGDGLSLIVKPTTNSQPTPTISIRFYVADNDSKEFIRLSLDEAKAMFSNGLELVEELRPKTKAERIREILLGAPTSAHRTDAILAILDEEGDL